MDDERLDFKSPLISVRRFSSAETTSADSSTSGLNSREMDRRTAASRRTSLPFYKPDKNSGPVRHPGVVPFAWENKRGRPKNGVVSESVGTRGAVVPPPSRMLKDREIDGIRPSVRPGSSVRTRKAVTFALNNGAAKLSDSYEDIYHKLLISEDKEEKGKDEVVKDVEVKAAVKNEVKEMMEEVEKVGEEMAIEVAEDDSQGDENVDNIDDDDREEDSFSDAPDTLSRTESFAMNCSVSGISGIPDFNKVTGSFSTDPQVRDFMMGRFLPAAQAVASESPQRTFKKTLTTAKEAVRITDRLATRDLGESPLSSEHRSNLALQYTKAQGVVDASYDEEEDDEQEYDNAGSFSSKGCALLPKLYLNGNLGRLNPVPGVKFQGRHRTGTKIKSTVQSSIGNPEDSHSWEDVYKHKLAQGYKWDSKDGSRSRSESNDLSFSSESPTAEGSASNRRSAGGLISPYRNEALMAPFQLEKSFLGVPSRESKSSKTDWSDICEKDVETFWQGKYHQSGLLDSDSGSPSLENSVYVDSANVFEGIVSNTSSFSTVTDNRMIFSLSDKSSEREMGNQRTGEAVIIEIDSPQQRAPEGAIAGLLSSQRRLNHHEFGCNDDSKQNSNESNTVIEVHNNGKKGAGLLRPLLPPPLPRTPSESWLSRTLPSVTSKNLTSQSLLAIGCQPRKISLKTTVVDKKLGTNKIPHSQVHRIQFAEVLPNPASPMSEM